MSHGGISSYQYYTVVTIPFCIVMAVITAAYAGKDDAYANTAERVLLAPISTDILVTAKILSCTLVIFLCSIITYVGAAVLTGIGIAGIGSIGLLFLGLSFVTSAAGTCIGLGMKNFLFIKNIMNIPICVFAVMGGAFFPIGTIDKVWNTVLYISPFRWVNRCMFLRLYDHQSRSIVVIIIFLTMTGILLSRLAVRIFKKEEYCNGNLPGYEE